ncbi:unnamed protein product [Gulo gulo]|uniref:Uncharacterized protein n=1 Tax=Gulo gulo TaxID=48420 RepID=A0A9X9M688_GULGU|nr:unnamed protein product [Gulo gulo]
MLPGAAAGHISALRAGRGVIQPAIRARWGVGGDLPPRGSSPPPALSRTPSPACPPKARSCPFTSVGSLVFKHSRPQTQTIIRASPVDAERTRAAYTLQPYWA